MKILTVLGARPQFIKAAVVSRALKKKNIEEIIIHTGQHFDPEMSAIFFSEMEISEPAYNLNINNAGHGAMTGRMMEQIEILIQQETPSLVLVYGDTNSTLAGALAAVKLHVPVAHVEAGLRSFNMSMPEEVNRIITDRISKILFCPTKTAIQNLENEGFRNYNVEITETGDVMYDAVLYYKRQALASSNIITKLGLTEKQFVLATVHRAENTDDPEKLQSIVDAFTEISLVMPVVWPVHPRTRKKIGNLSSLHLIEPVGYFDMLSLLHYSKMVLTDSGGLQKEAYMMSKFCITLRDQTEWVELTQAGVNRITGHEKKKIIEAFQTLRSQKFPSHENLYGSGNAADLIASEILKIK